MTSTPQHADGSAAVFAALDRRKSSNPTREEREEMRANGIRCAMCLYYGLAHKGDHLVSGPVAEDVEHYDTLRESIPSDMPDTVWESDALSKGSEHGALRWVAALALAVVLPTLAPVAMVATAIQPLETVANALTSAARAGTQIEAADREVSTVRVSYVEPIGARKLYVELNNGATYKLNPCRTEDGRHCYWDADDRGNNVGRSFVVVAGRVISSRMVGGAR